MSKHIIVSEETHTKFKSIAKRNGMKFNGFLNAMIDLYESKDTGIKDLSKMAFIPNRGEKIIGDTAMVYEVVGEHTSWDINCDCCGERVDNSTEIDIYIDRLKDRERINACHYCNNTHVIPLLKKTEVNGDIQPIDLKNYILDKYEGK